jgi:hypothetical protein
VFIKRKRNFYNIKIIIVLYFLLYKFKIDILGVFGIWHNPQSPITNPQQKKPLIFFKQKEKFK